MENYLKNVQRDVHEDILAGYHDRDQRTIRDMLFMGLAEEAGEVAGIGKRILRGYDKDKTVATPEHLCEELGDVLWYLAGIADGFDLTLDDIWEYNRKKLEERYGNRV